MSQIVKVNEKLKEIVDRVKSMRDYYMEPYQRMDKDIEFRDGKQWAGGETNKEERWTVPHTKRFINRVTNAIRMNPYGINVDGAGDFGDVVRQAIREIETESHAGDAYCSGLENAVTCGRGGIVVDTEYLSDNTDEQKITINIVTDPRSIHLEPGHQRVDGSDAQYGAYSSYIFKKQAIQAYGDECVEPGEFAYLYPDYASALDYIPQVCYQELETKSVNRYFLHNGTYVDEGDLDKKAIDIMKINGAIKSTRKINVKQLHIYKIVGTKIVYETELPIPYLMLVPVYGDRYYRDGRWDFAGLIQLLRTPAMLANLYKSKEVDLAKLAPRSPWLLAIAQAAGNEEQWANANSIASDALLYKHVDANGTPIPPPMRVDNTAQTAQLTASYQQCVADMYDVTGMPREMFGAFEGANQSGKSVLARQQFAEIATAQYMTNLAHSIEQVGRVVLSLLPIIYTEDREYNITDEDGNSNKVVVNFSKADIDWTTMKVEVSSGPSYESRRKETIEALTQMFPPGDPQAALVKDIIVNELDTPYAKAISRRLRKALPPGMVGENGAPPVDPQAMQALQEAQDAYAQLEQGAEQLKNVLITTQLELNQLKASKADVIRIKEMELTSDERKTAIIETNKFRIATLNAAAKGVQVPDSEVITDDIQARADMSSMVTMTMADEAVKEGEHIAEQPTMGGNAPSEPFKSSRMMDSSAAPAMIPDASVIPRG